MKQQAFEQKYESLWLEIESILSRKEDRSSIFSTSDKTIVKEFPSLYRQLCQHLAVAKSRNYTPQLIGHLNELVLQSHHLLYQNSRYSQHKVLIFIFRTFPQAVRANGKLVLVSSLLFYLPLFFFALSCYFNPELIYSISDVFTVMEYESMYDPSNESLGRERNSSDDLTMFGYYIFNNIGIGFRTFALGLIGGVGTVFILLFNGLHIGSVAGYLTQIGFVDTFYGFVVGHAAFELTGIVFSGAAGLKIGLALVDPGNLSRTDAMKLASKEAIIIVYGAAVMLLIAAFIEAFWSSSTAIPNSIKYTFGGSMAVLLTAYFLFVGKTRGSQ